MRKLTIFMVVLLTMPLFLSCSMDKGNVVEYEANITEIDLNKKIITWVSVNQDKDKHMFSGRKITNRYPGNIKLIGYKSFEEIKVGDVVGIKERYKEIKKTALKEKTGKLIAVSGQFPDEIVMHKKK